MKCRIIIAIVAIALIIGGGIAEEILVSKVFEEFSERLSDILDSPNEEYSYEEVEATHEWWAKRHKYMELSLPHVQLNEIEITYGELLGAVEAEDYDSATALLNRIKSTSDALSEMFGFRLGNII